MKGRSLWGWLLALSLAGAVPLAAPQESVKELVASLNTLLARQAMTADVVELSASGMLSRKLNDGREVRIQLKDVAAIEQDYDGAVGNLLLKCAEKVACAEMRATPDAPWIKAPLTVISFKPGANLDEVAALYRQLQAILRK